MAWRRAGDKPLSEPILTNFTDAYTAVLGGDELIVWSLNQIHFKTFVIQILFILREWPAVSTNAPIDFLKQRPKEIATELKSSGNA